MTTESTQTLQSAPSLSDEELRRQLIAELDELTRRLQELTPGYQAPPFSPQGFAARLEELLRRYPQTQAAALNRLRDLLSSDALDPEVLKGTWYMLNYTLQYNADLVKRHFSGEYETDEWGMDWELLDAVRPFFTFLYKVYWRVETTGIERIPIEGRALLAANHGGQVPWDGLMLSTAVFSDHPAQRTVRVLYSDWLPRMPFASTWLVRMGQTLAAEDNGLRLLEQDKVVAVFPEGVAGLGKTIWERYRLARFGPGDFIKMALRSRAPLIPVAIVGAEETYISLFQSRSLARLTGLPHLPITPTFPWLGLLGLVPLPTKWTIDFGEPIPLDGYGPDAADNLILVAQLSDRVRHTVQEMLHDRLAQRKSVLLG